MNSTYLKFVVLKPDMKEEKFHCCFFFVYGKGGGTLPYVSVFVNEGNVLKNQCCITVIPN